MAHRYPGHRFLIGSHGTGKTSLLVEMMQDGIARSHGVCFIDAHGLTLPGTVFDPEITRWNRRSRRHSFKKPPKAPGTMPG